jgi:deoxyribose-phosphate aldolase
MITPEQVASICDHTFLLRPESYREKGISPVRKWEEEFYNFLKESISFPSDPYAVCVRPETVKYTKDFLRKNAKQQIKVASVVGFPQGSFYDLVWKIREAEAAIYDGADEIYFVINYENLKSGNFSDNEYLDFEMRSLSYICQDKGVVSKAILETSELTCEQIKTACKIAAKNDIYFVKSSSGFTDKGTQVTRLMLMRENYMPRGVKISGGVTPENLAELLFAASGWNNGALKLDPMQIRIGESSLLTKLFKTGEKATGY